MLFADVVIQSVPFSFSFGGHRWSDNKSFVDLAPKRRRRMLRCRRDDEPQRIVGHLVPSASKLWAVTKSAPTGRRHNNVTTFIIRQQQP